VALLQTATCYLVGDVLTVGNHFRAMSNKLALRFPDADIAAIFVARRAIPHDNFDDLGT
jgi:hypothetical protein